MKNMENMKKKGFTLIELLAVIVVLSVIALITVPMIMNVIEKTRKEAFKDSVLGAFTTLDYYLLENDLQDIPEAGIEVKDLKLKNNSFEYGIIIKNSEGKLEAINVSDGKYCAQGEQTKLEINKGECDAEAPTVEVEVEGKKATITLRDNVGVIGYAVTEKGKEVTEWTTISETKEITKEWEAEKAGEYTAWVKDKYGKVNHEDFTIKESAFCAYKAGEFVQTFENIGNVEEFTVPCDGIYKLEVWGAQGGSAGGASGGKGGYSIGYRKFVQGSSLYIYAGAQGASSPGSGNVGNESFGRGASYITTKSGLLSTFNDDRASVLIVAGGGGGGYQYVGYSNKVYTNNITGGTGGGLDGGSSANKLGNLGLGGSQSSGPGGFGAAGGSLGGGGWYGGGGAGNTNVAGGGGSGYIDGVPEITDNETTYSPSTENGVQSGNGKAQITLVSIAE